ncbi:unnamed protein product [Urochloa humidicola]
MVNTRSGSGVDQPPQRRYRVANRNPEPEQNQSPIPEPMAGNMKQFLQAQMTLLQTLTASVNNMQANQGANNQNQLPRSKHQEFISNRPPTFSHAADPLQAEDWLKTVNKMLDIAQCNDREKVMYSSRRLEGTASDWWDAYVATHQDAQIITWQEFQNSFRSHHIPAGLMKLKKKEFLGLKQGGMSMSEYRDKFIQLSHYAPEEVSDDEKKQERFMEGLNGALNYMLTPTTFPTFQSLVDKAIFMEHKHNALGEKRKLNGSSQSNSVTRTCFNPPQPNTQFRQGGQGGNYAQNQGQRLAPPPQRPAYQQGSQQNRQNTQA